MSPRMAWRAIQAALPKEAIISSDIGNNCAIGNAYPSFEAGRKYLAPGLFGPCGYGLPSIVGAKIACPDVPVVGFAGDGAFGIAVTELTAIATTNGARKSAIRRSGMTTISSAPSLMKRSAMQASPAPAACKAWLRAPWKS
jgi:thiamine pyrophosphate-dependent acetolactate synthase large subunit-like protein